MDVIGGIGSAIGLVVKAKELADKLKDLELKEVIVDLQSRLIDLKLQIAELREENVHLKAEARKLSMPPELVVKEGMYYKTEGDGPFCTACFDNNGKLIRVTEQAKVFWDIGRWRCGVCTVKYGGRM